MQAKFKYFACIIFYFVVIYGKYMILSQVYCSCLKYKFLFLANILSLLIGMTVPVYRIILDKEFVFYSDTFYYFIPTIIILVLSFFFAFAYKKYPIYVKIFSIIVNISILIIEVFYAFLFCMLLTILNSDRIFSDSAEYNEALRSIKCSNCVEHFPRELPANAKNVQLYKSQSSWHGDINMVVKFNIDETYIKSEIKKNKYIKIEKPKDYSFSYESILTGSSRKIKIDDFTFYVIKDKSFGATDAIANTYSYGIGVNKELNQILYYFSIID